MKNRENDFEDVEPKEFYDLASSESAINRNIYMRIYYSVFLFLREWLKMNTDYKSCPKGEHTRLANYIRFKGPFNMDLNESIYAKLVLLKKLRHQADYKLRVPNKFSPNYEKWDFTSINSAFNIAKNIIKTFKEI